jgi:hypothetical protein
MKPKFMHQDLPNRFSGELNTDADPISAMNMDADQITGFNLKSDVGIDNMYQRKKKIKKPKTKRKPVKKCKCK